MPPELLCYRFQCNGNVCSVFSSCVNLVSRLVLSVLSFEYFGCGVWSLFCLGYGFVWFVGVFGMLLVLVWLGLLLVFFFLIYMAIISIFRLSRLLFKNVNIFLCSLLCCSIGAYLFQCHPP